MFNMKYKRIIIVHDNNVYCMGCSRADAGQILFRMPMEQVLNDESIAEQVPKKLRGNNKYLCIVPDHWFDIESYPFRSKKSSLIEPFLERKLTAAHPEKKAIQHFFNYRNIAPAGEANNLYAYFIQDNSAFRLYSALKRMHLAPRQITAPGFLWEHKLAQMTVDFGHKGTLLIHMGEKMCRLYFYFNGNYLFSRSVVLTDAPDAVDALTFEINQSLYMFSQKAKSDLDRVYLLTENPEMLDLISRSLGRDVEDITPQVNETRFFEFPEVPSLNGLLKHNDLVSPPRFFSVTHRRIKQALEWWPVQWAGILVGGLLVLSLLGENLFLNSVINKENAEKHKTHQQMSAATGQHLTEYEDILNHVLNRVERPTCADALRRLLASLPESVWVRKLNVTVEDDPSLHLEALVLSKNADHFKAALALLVANVRHHFKNAQAFSINDIDIRMDPSARAQSTFRYRISLRLNLI